MSVENLLLQIIDNRRMPVRDEDINSLTGPFSIGQFAVDPTKIPKENARDPVGLKHYCFKLVYAHPQIFKHILSNQKSYIEKMASELIIKKSSDGRLELDVLFINNYILPPSNYAARACFYTLSQDKDILTKLPENQASFVKEMSLDWLLAQPTTTGEQRVNFSRARIILYNAYIGELSIKFCTPSYKAISNTELFQAILIAQAKIKELETVISALERKKARPRSDSANAGEFNCSASVSSLASAASTAATPSSPDRDREIASPPRAKPPLHPHHPGPQLAHARAFMPIILDHSVLSEISKIITSLRTKLNKYSISLNWNGSILQLQTPTHYTPESNFKTLGNIQKAAADTQLFQTVELTPENNIKCIPFSKHRPYINDILMNPSFHEAVDAAHVSSRG